jgi:hypothetical protein
MKSIGRVVCPPHTLHTYPMKAEHEPLVSDLIQPDGMPDGTWLDGIGRG